MLIRHQQKGKVCKFELMFSYIFHFSEFAKVIQQNSSDKTNKKNAFYIKTFANIAQMALRSDKPNKSRRAN